MSLAQTLDAWLNSLLRKRGLILMRQSNPNYYLGRRMKLMRSYGIDLVLDVGANSGQYGRRLRSLGYGGDIVSFEPMRAAYENLSSLLVNDARWTCLPIGLGDFDGNSVIHVSGNSVSSSILPMLQTHSSHAPASVFVGEEAIGLRQLDSLDAEHAWTRANSWLKIDVQGYEDKVLAGASSTLPRISAIQLELSLIPLYEGQKTLVPMLEMLADHGFDPVAFEPGFEDKATGEYLQLDGIFRNRRLRPASHG